MGDDRLAVRIVLAILVVIAVGQGCPARAGIIRWERGCSGMKIAETTHTQIHRVDDVGPDGAHHEYEVRSNDGEVLCQVSFQNRPIGDVGVNGVQHTDLLLIVRDRLDCYQRGPYASALNETTCTAVGSAIASEATRTRRRALSGAEGTTRVN